MIVIEHHYITLNNINSKLLLSHPTVSLKLVDQPIRFRLRFSKNDDLRYATEWSEQNEINLGLERVNNKYINGVALKAHQSINQKMSEGQNLSTINLGGVDWVNIEFENQPRYPVQLLQLRVLDTN